VKVNPTVRPGLQRQTRGASGRFSRDHRDPITHWIADLTSLDLSGVDVSGLQDIDTWLDALEAQKWPEEVFDPSVRVAK
jgi:hypothetical protein